MARKKHSGAVARRSGGSASLDVEKRVLKWGEGAELELREDAASGGEVVSGYASVFNRETEFWPGYREVIRPGAFTRTLKRDNDVKALWDHSTTYILGARRAGSLELREDKTGLAFDIDPRRAGGDWSPTIRDLVLGPLGKGEVDGASFAFRATGAEEKHVPEHGDEPGYVLREITEVELQEVSIVPFPQYSEATVALRDIRSELERRLEVGALTEDQIRGIFSEILSRRDSLPLDRIARREELRKTLEEIEA